MAAEIKITIGKGGLVKINDKQVNAETAKFTEALAADLGEVQERHVAEGFEYNSEDSGQSQTVGN